MASNGSGRTQPAIVLTTRTLETLKPGTEAFRVPDLRCAGLAVRVAPSGLKTWDALYRIRGAGTVKRKSLGAFPAVSLADARERMAALGKAAQAGRDLLAEEVVAKVEAAGRITVAGLLDDYAKRGTAKLRSGRQMEQALRNALRPLMDRPAEDVTRRDLRSLFDAIADRGRPAAADRAKQLTFALFRFGIKRDHVMTNPAAGLERYRGASLRDRVLSPDEIRKFWNWLDQDAELTPDYVDALRLQLCFGARISETAGMATEEIDTAKWLWTLPAARSKNKKPRVTPIVGIAREIIEGRLQYTQSGPLFFNSWGRATISSASIAHALNERRTTAPIDHFTTHDLRRTVATQLADMGFALDIIAQTLGHDAGGDRNTLTLVKHYVRNDQTERKRTALAAWDARLRGYLEGQTQPANVVQFADVMR